MSRYDADPQSSAADEGDDLVSEPHRWPSSRAPTGAKRRVEIGSKARPYSARSPSIQRRPFLPDLGWSVPNRKNELFYGEVSRSCSRPETTISGIP